MISNYLQVLEESLRKKLAALDRVESLCVEQEKLLKAPSFSEEAFDASMEEKGALIDELNRLDEGFESLYAHIREELPAQKEKYKTQIAALQQLVKDVTDKSVSIQAQEARNKALMENYFTGRKKEIQQGRKGSRAAINYYRSMSDSKSVQPQFMDKKK